MTTPPVAPPRLPPLVRRWEPRGAESPETAATLAATLHLPQPLCRLLALRGFTDPHDARDFLKPRLERMHDPFDLAGMHAAVARIDAALAVAIAELFGRRLRGSGPVASLLEAIASRTPA